MKFFIWSFEHDQWWKPNSAGYTSDIKDAGEYTQKQAIEICLQANLGGKNEAMIPTYEKRLIRVERK